MEPYRATEAAGEACRFVFAHLRDGIALAGVPLLVVTTIMMVLALLGHYLAPGPADDSIARPSNAALLAVALACVAAYIATYVMFAVAWHRRYLLASDPVVPGAVFRWQRRHWRFVLKAAIVAGAFVIVFYLLGVVLMAPMRGLLDRPDTPGGALMVLYVGALLLNAVLGYLFARFALAFPAAAIDDTVTGLRTSWKLTEGHSLQVFVALVLVVVPVWLVNLAIEAAAGWLAAPAPGWRWIALLAVLTLASQAIYMLGVALLTSVLSITYRRLTAPARGAPAAAAGGGA